MSRRYCSFSPELEQEGLMLVQEVMLGSLRAMRAGVRHTQHRSELTLLTRLALMSLYLFSFFNAPSVPTASKNCGTLRSSVERSVYSVHFREVKEAVFIIEEIKTPQECFHSRLSGWMSRVETRFCDSLT